MVRTRSVATFDAATGHAAPDAMATGTPVRILIDGLQRQRRLILLSILASLIVATTYTAMFAQTTTTAHLQLQSHPLPLVAPEYYRVPTPNDVQDIVVTSRVLQPPPDGVDFPSVTRLQGSLTVTSNAQKGNVNVDMRLPIDFDVKKILNQIGDNVSRAILEDRRDLLERHAKYIETLISDGANELEMARVNLATQLNHARTDQEGDSKYSAELQTLLAKQSRIEASIIDAQQNLAQIERDMRVANRRKKELLIFSISQVYERRQLQIDAFAKGLTANTQRFTEQQAMLSQLASLRQRIDSDLSALFDSHDKNNNRSNLDQEQARHSSGGIPSIPADSVPDDDTKQLGANDSVSTNENVLESKSRDADVVELFDIWTAEILGVGSHLLGEPDEHDRDLTGNYRKQLADLEIKSFDQKVEKNDLIGALSDYRISVDDVKNQISQLLRDHPSISLVDPEVMQLQAVVAQREQQCAWLAQQLSRITQIRNCTIHEYFVSSLADFDPLKDVKSNRLKLFVFVFSACGLLFSVPPVVLELRRLRPSPAQIVSRRWNLPLLGFHSNRHSKSNGTNTPGQPEDNEVRIIALRIQQSTIAPEGRVVMFCGLDHDESPLNLIYEIARCLSFREENVLIIETAKFDTVPSFESSETFEMHARPGLADFLAGSYDTAHELIAPTDIRGVSFLPRGCKNTTAEVMASTRLTQFLERVRKEYTIILLCGPSTLNPADLQMLAARTDGIVFTVNKSSLRDIYGHEVIRDLVQLGAPIIGITEQPVGKMCKRQLDSVSIDNHRVAAISR